MFSRSLQAAEEYYRASLGLLIVLQGLDASGKDSTIKHVTSGLNPQGVEVRSFKRPSAAEVREHAGQPIGPAASIFVIVLAQSEATARTYAARHEEAFSAASDLVGLGAANVDPDHQERLELKAAAFQPRHDSPVELEHHHDKQRAVDRPYYRDRERPAVRDHDQVVDTTDKHPDRDREQRDGDRHEHNALAA
jgi:hypothetical protein